MASRGRELGNIAFSAEEIAAVLADTYYDVDLIRQKIDEDDAAAEREREVQSARRRQRM